MIVMNVLVLVCVVSKLFWLLQSFEFELANVEHCRIVLATPLRNVTSPVHR